MRYLWWDRETGELKGFLSDDLVIRKSEFACIYSFTKSNGIARDMCTNLPRSVSLATTY